jgi:peptidyl-tRNA hydrolase, PTH1 family
MLLLVGLGNPGEKYTETRHNAGFMMLDALQEKYSFPDFREEKKLGALVSRGTLFGQEVLLAKPTTFMNLSGKVVAALLTFYKIPREHLVVFHDDVDIAAGELRATPSSRSAGNNGVQSIIDVLGSQDFFRLRLGVGRPTQTLGACIPTHDYVLQNFSEEEKDLQKALLPLVEEAIKNFWPIKNSR